MLSIVKNTTFPSLLDLLAPHSCRGCGRMGEVFCNCCKNDIILNRKNYCPNCKRLNLTGQCPKCHSLPPTFIVGERDSILGDLIHNYKYNSTRALAKPLAELLNQTLPAIDGKTSIIPLPTITPHIRSRGFDHTYKIAKTLAKLRGKDYTVEKILFRAENTVQVGSDKKTRLKQATEAYKINEKFDINPTTTYLLFDDVWTTGASMKSAIKKLQQAGAKKIIVAILALSRLN